LFYSNFNNFIFIILCRFILDNGFDERHRNTQFSSMLLNHNLKFLCDTWYISSSLTCANNDISEGK